MSNYIFSAGWYHKNKHIFGIDVVQKGALQNVLTISEGVCSHISPLSLDTLLNKIDVH